ncbi:MAG TPA: aspartate-alanine antiporter [Candidatus Baltobacteraceae bacterium]|nr:aspartate-alanine antiporter [Candidatus Baltobacteraceae bacterium]
MYSLMHYPVDTIRQYPEIAIFLTLAIGFWFGSLKFGSFSLGAVTSSLIAGLLIGQLHIPIAPVAQSTFFMMFLFAVGYGVGPQFFRALKKDGLPQVAFALLVAASGLLCAFALGKLLGFNPGLTAGLLSGGYTNSGTLGVASGYFHQLGLGADEAAAMASLAAIAYAVTYPFGTAGAAWFLGTLGPKLLKVDLAAASKELERTMGVRGAEPGVGSAYRPVTARAYRVENDGLVGQDVRQIAATLGTTDAFVVRVRQNGGIIEPNTGTILQNGATVAIAGHPQALLTAAKTVGPEVDDAELLGFPTEQLDIVITKKDAANHTIKELQDAELARTGHRLFLSKLMRGGSEVKRHPDLRLQRHDVLTLLGPRKEIEDAAKFLGYADRATPTSDIAFMSVAVVIGAMIGAMTIHVSGIPLSLSTSVGALIAGLVCGYLRSAYRTFGRIPDPALWVFNNVGLNGFIAVVGLDAAPGLIAGLKAYGLGLFLAGMVVSIVPLVVGIFAGKYIFKFHPAITLGACAGARTTTAALGALQEAANSPIPAIGYTIPYAVGRIVLAICGVIIVLLMQ